MGQTPISFFFFVCLFLYKDINRYHIEETTLLALPSFNPTHFDSKSIFFASIFFFTIPEDKTKRERDVEG